MNLIDITFFGRNSIFQLERSGIIWNKSPVFNKFKFAKGNERLFDTSLITPVAFSCRVTEVCMTFSYWKNLKG